MFGYVRLVLFIWAIYEVAYAMSLYILAYQIQKSKIMMALAILLGSGLFSLVFRFFLVYATKIDPSWHQPLKVVGLLPIALMALASRYFRHKSLDTDQVREEIIKLRRKNGKTK